MLFGIGPMEFAAIIIVGLLIFGPEKLPKMAADSARFLRDIRRMATAARQDLTEALGTELPDLDLGDLNPKSFLKSNVLDVLDDLDSPQQPNGNGSAGRGPRGASGAQPHQAGSDASAGDEAFGGAPTAGDADDDDVGKAVGGDVARPTGYDADTT